MTYHKLSHTVWECKYHVVFIPKYRQKRIYGQIRRLLGEVFHELARHKESVIEEGHLMPDHAHMLISIPPKYSVSNVMGYIKGKSAIYIAREVKYCWSATVIRCQAIGVSRQPKVGSAPKFEPYYLAHTSFALALFQT